jgi:hypothetical protein
MTPLVARENPPLALDGFGQILRSLLSQVTSHKSHGRSFRRDTGRMVDIKTSQLYHRNQVPLILDVQVGIVVYERCSICGWYCRNRA